MKPRATRLIPSCLEAFGQAHVSLFLRTFICLLGLASVPAGAADLRFAGATRYQVSGNSVTLTVERITNTTTGGISGTARLELWAFPAPSTGASQTGYRTAILTLAQISGGGSTTGIASSVAYAPPPAGQRWFYTLYLTEFTGASTSNDGYVGRDFVNFPGAPIIQSQPQGGTVTAGDPVNLSVVAVGVPVPTYQWAKDGTNIAGATAATLRLPAVRSSEAGSYRVTVTNSEGFAQSNAVTLAVNTIIAKQPARLGNLSVRSIAGTGDQTLTAGFVVGGGSKQLLVRGIGPTLASFNVSGFLTDPRLSLYNEQGSLLNQNDDWGGGATLVNAFSAVGAFPLPANSRDAALFGAIAAGGNSVQVGSGSGTGIALLEAYDADPITSVARLINLSARNEVGLDSNALFVGFVVAGTGAKTVLIRGVGPALAQFGVGGVLADPRLTVYDSQSRALLSNDDWSSSLASTFAAVGAFPLPTGSKDAALVTTLPPGAYSAELAGVNRTTGVGLVEVYEIPDANSTSLNVGTAGGGTGTVTLGSSAPITPGSQITLTANPALGSTFIGWTGSESGTTPTITVPADARLNTAAVFARGPFTLTTTTAGTGSGVVTTSPFGASFTDGTSVTLTAVPAVGSIFAGWSGDVTGTAASLNVTMNANKTAVATFTLSSSGGSGGGVGRGGIPTTRSVYEGTYIGQFNMRYSYSASGVARTGAKSFNITLQFQTLVVGAGRAILRVTRVTSSEPLFGAQAGQVPVESDVALPEPPQDSADGGIRVTFQNGYELITLGPVHMSTDAQIISNVVSAGNARAWEARSPDSRAFITTVPEYNQRDTGNFQVIEMTWALSRSGL